MLEKARNATSEVTVWVIINLRKARLPHFYLRAMKLRKNVLQPLRLETPAFAAEPTEFPDIIRQGFVSSGFSNLLRFDERPAALLTDYTEHRQKSTAGNLFRTANRIQASVDSVVVLSLGNSGLGAKAIAQACTQPYWNYLSRADRGSKPRMFFIDDRSDNDTIQGLLHLLGHHRPANSNFDPDKWALMVLASEPTLSPQSQRSVTKSETGWQLEAMLSALDRHVANDASAMSQRLMAVAPQSGFIAKRLSTYGEYDFFASYDEPPAMQCLGPLGLLPATVLGINIMELLAGASWMSQHFHKAPPAENLIFRLVDWLSTFEAASANPSHIHIWNPGMQGCYNWYRDLQRAMVPFAASPRNADTSIFPLPQNVLAPRGILESGEIHVLIERPRFDPIAFDHPDNAQQRFQGKIEHPSLANRPLGTAAAEIRLAELDELHLGQWMQWVLLLAASSKLIGLSPPEANVSPFDTEYGLEMTT